MRHAVLSGCAIGLVVVAACAAPAASGPDPRQTGTPPDMELRIGHKTGHKTASDPVDSYCVSGNGAGRCVDGRHAGEALRLPAGTAALALRWKWEAQTLQVRLCRDRDSRDCKKISDLALGESRRVRLEPGRYVLTAFTTWDGGDASYAWSLRVR